MSEEVQCQEEAEGRQRAEVRGQINGGSSSLLLLFILICYTDRIYMMMSLPVDIITSHIIQNNQKL